MSTTANYKIDLRNDKNPWRQLLLQKVIKTDFLRTFRIRKAYAYFLPSSSESNLKLFPLKLTTFTCSTFVFANSSATPWTSSFVPAILENNTLIFRLESNISFKLTRKKAKLEQIFERFHRRQKMILARSLKTSAWYFVFKLPCLRAQVRRTLSVLS